MTEVLNEVEKVCPAEEIGDSSEKLKDAIKDRTEKIKECYSQSDLWLQKGKTLQEKLSEDLIGLQNQFGIKLELPLAPKAKRSSVKVSKDATVSELILSYLEKNRNAKTKDIRNMLIGKGRKKTNPGVALSRLVNDKKIKNVERGVYDLV